MEEVHKKKKKLTQWGSHILTSHMMVTKNPQNVHRNYFWAILLTFIFDIKIDINICEPHYVNLFFFVNLLHSLHVWWLVRGTLLMEWGLQHDFFVNFSTRGERYYFGWRGACKVRICTRGENVYMRWLWMVEGTCEVRICMQGENVYARWLWMVEETCEVRICTQGENVYARWEHACEVTLSGGGGTRGENMYMRWECVHKVTLNGGGDMRGENMYVRWECVHKVRTCARGDFEGWRGQLYTDP